MSSLTSKHFLISAWIASLCLWPFTGKYIVHVVTWTNGQRRCFNRSSYNWSEFSCKACSAWCCPQFMPLRKRWCFLLSRERAGALWPGGEKQSARRGKHLPCPPPQMDSLHQRKTIFLLTWSISHAEWTYEYKLCKFTILKRLLTINNLDFTN